MGKSWSDILSGTELDTVEWYLVFYPDSISLVNLSTDRNTCPTTLSRGVVLERLSIKLSNKIDLSV